MRSWVSTEMLGGNWAGNFVARERTNGVQIPGGNSTKVAVHPAFYKGDQGRNFS